MLKFKPLLSILKEDKMPTGNMIAIYPPKEVVSVLAKLGSEAEDDLHVTLIYLGKGDLGLNKDLITELVRQVCLDCQSINLKTSGVGRFNHEGGIAYASIDAPGLAKLRTKIANILDENGVDYAKDHDFTPHLTLTYGIDLQNLPQVPELNWISKEIVLKFGTDKEIVTLG